MLYQKTINKGLKQANSIKLQFSQQPTELMNKTIKPSLNYRNFKLPQVPRQQPLSLNDYFQQKNPNQFSQLQPSQQDQQSPQLRQKKKFLYNQEIVSKQQLDKAKNLLQNVQIMKNHQGHFFQSDIRYISDQCGLSSRKVREIKKEFIKDPTLSELYFREEQRKTKKEKFLQLINYYIDSIFQKTPNLSMDELVSQIIKKIPLKYKKKVKLSIVKSVMEKRQQNGIFGIQSPGFQLLSFNSKNTINILQYSKSILRILDQNKLVYFLGTDIVATQKQTTNEYQQRKIVLRGVLGSNMLSFWDIFIGVSDSSHHNRSLLNLLAILRKKNQEQQIHLAMSRQFMEEYKQALRSVSSLGFIFVDFGEKAKLFNPLKFWFKDIKELANKYDVKTRVKFQESFQHVCSLLDRKNYAVYFNTCIKEMRAIVQESESQKHLRTIK